MIIHIYYEKMCFSTQGIDKTMELLDEETKCFKHVCQY